MNDIEKQFIEGAARALYVTAWAEREENTCGRCGFDEVHSLHSDADRCSGCTNPGEHHEFNGRSFAGQELVDVAPSTPDYARLEAARLLGKVEQANGLNIAAIMAAAARADLEEFWSRDDDKAVADLVAGYGERAAANRMAKMKEEAQLDQQGVALFGHYIAMMAMGEGVSWFDDHAQFDLPDTPAKWRPGVRPFVVPLVEFTMFDLEDL